MTQDDDVDAIVGDVSMAADLAWAAGVQAEHPHTADQSAPQFPADQPGPRPNPRHRRHSLGG